MKHAGYELAFHLNPDLEESQVQQLAQDIESYVTSAGGVVSFKRLPERTRLSYLINHKRTAYFGYYHFSIEATEGLAAIDEQLKHNNNVLRYLLVKMPVDTGKARFKFRTGKPKTATEKPSDKQPPTDSKELEKQLEEVLENL